MKILKVYAAVIVFTAVAAFTSCKKDDGVAPAQPKTHQAVVMDTGGDQPPQPPPPPNP